jgi:hypothetical protein
VCPESSNEGNDVDLSNEDECVRIIAGSNNFAWNRRKQGDFAFMDQDIKDDIPAFLDDEVTTYITLFGRGRHSPLADGQNERHAWLSTQRSREELSVSSHLFHVYSSDHLLESVLW